MGRTMTMTQTMIMTMITTMMTTTITIMITTMIMTMITTMITIMITTMIMTMRMTTTMIVVVASLLDVEVVVVVVDKVDKASLSKQHSCGTSREWFEEINYSCPAPIYPNGASQGLKVEPPVKELLEIYLTFHRHKIGINNRM